MLCWRRIEPGALKSPDGLSAGGAQRGQQARRVGIGRIQLEHLLELRNGELAEHLIELRNGELAWISPQVSARQPEMGGEIAAEIVDIDRIADPGNRLSPRQPCVQVLVPQVD